MFKVQDKPTIMGILNVTPDSFSDGGRFTAASAAVKQAIRMLREGADIIDIGGESTRPGSEQVSEQQQIQRVLPVIEALVTEFQDDIVISIDTTRSAVARAALSAGAKIINDVSAARDDELMFDLAVEFQVPLVLMHMQGQPNTMQDAPYYDDVNIEVLAFLQQRIDSAIKAGLQKNQIILDPGIGFGKRKQDNIDLMAGLKQFADTGFPVLLGASRKRFMGAICDVREPSELVAATAVTTALGVMAGVQMFRVHDVKENRQAADVAWAIKQSVS